MLYLLVINLYNFKAKLFQIILIMSPIVLFLIIKNLNNSILLAFQKFKLVFISNIIYALTITVSLVLIFIFQIMDPIILIAYGSLSGAFLSCIISIFLMIPIIHYKKRSNIPIQYKQEFLEVHKKYGLYLTLADVFVQFTNLTVYLLFLNFDLIILSIMMCKFCIRRNFT